MIDPDNPNGTMIEDKPLKWQGQNVYGTTAEIIFNGASDGSETMKVNGVPIQVIDNKFRFKMTDNQEHETNQYTILLEKHDLNDFDKILGSYEFNYLIKQDIPNLDLKWYAWNPAANPDQKKLIEPTLPNGEINPNYDREVSPKTGTKTQIMWIKHAAEKPFPLDPLNKDGNIITNGIYDQGFLAEGSVSGMGINQTFNDPWIKSVQRVRVDSQTLKPISTWEMIKSDKEGQYFSKSGTYLYLITDQKGMTSNKFIIIGQQWQDKYAKFLDVLNNPATAVPFWSTIQGFHLKNYLGKYKQLNSADIQNLTFEQVASYWKEYVSDVKTQKVGPGVNPDNQIILNNLHLDDIKMNKANIADIKDEILHGANGIIKQLSKYKLEYEIDYQIVDLELKAKELLNGYHNSGQAVVKLTIKALDTSTKASGISNPIQVRNSKTYDPNNAVDLSNINFDAYRYNFSPFTIEQLKVWILQAIDKKFQSLNLKLVYQVDYHVSSLDDETLAQFIKTKELTKLELIIKADIMSDNAKNSTLLILINDPDGDIAPPEPPDPKPDPDIKPIVPDDNSWISQKQNLIIMTVATILIVTGSCIFIFFKYRLKKGIGGKRNKMSKQEKNKC